MGKRNHSTWTEFVIVGFSDLPELQLSLSIASFFIYLLTLVGNVLILMTVFISPQLHSPMYFFLSNLSFLDICYTSVTVPKTAVIFTTGDRSVSLAGCLTQLYCFLSLASTEYMLLTAMAYDRYVAICHPLHYALVMSNRACVLLAAASWMLGFLEPIAQTALLSQYSFCGSNVINHFFCDITALLKLSCSGTEMVEVVTFCEGVVFGFSSFLLICISYVFIISAILRIHSAEGRCKAFSTCASHLTVVVLFYGTLICAYMRPSSAYSMDQNKLFAVFYNTVIPMLNPIIYCLRNKEIKGALRRACRQNR
ncbi:olfactory receptor 5V1-like [Rhinatrema bivittatum]|uniref:olfactory receptor 5V1-like n=1 Tax=Rhinatrema bivittatum TaxID=194408 RepID=UPI001127954F|nr:olfactory receptor 5V1-like [Rhinatrema bivittatum]XP_029442650.1 olfactory receptor 5V1-like [Rhinatrema bivittatum]